MVRESSGMVYERSHCKIALLRDETEGDNMYIHVRYLQAPNTITVIIIQNRDEGWSIHTFAFFSDLPSPIQDKATQCLRFESPEHLCGDADEGVRISRHLFYMTTRMRRFTIWTFTHEDHYCSCLFRSISFFRNHHASLLGNKSNKLPTGTLTFLHEFVGDVHE